MKAQIILCLQTTLAWLRACRDYILLFFALRLLRRLTLLGLRYGNVRTIRSIADSLRKLGEKTESPEVVETADWISERAEEIVLQRSKAWR